VRALQERTGKAVDRRLLSNYLRGNQPPPGPATARRANDELPGGEAHEKKRCGTPETIDSEEAHGAYGLLWALGPAWVDELTERLVEEGYLSRDTGPGRKLSATPSGERLLAGRELPGARLLPQRPQLGSNPQVEKKLRELRRRLAKEAGRPPYGIFSNATLAHLAARRPRNLGELAAVPGLGEKRLRQFGRRILAALRRGAR
jgi:superfamily II DNA helicase RecQ